MNSKVNSILRELKRSNPKIKSFDAHAHSFFSYDVPQKRRYDPYLLFYEALKRGMDFVTFTDHDTYEQNKYMAEKLKDSRFAECYVPGTEFSISDYKIGHTIHCNVYLLSESDFKSLKTLSRDLSGFIEYCRSRNLPFQYNHPLWFEMSELSRIKNGNLDSIIDIAKEFSVIEVCNSGRPHGSNMAGKHLAEFYGKGASGGSDDHRGGVGTKALTLAEGRNFREFWENVKLGNSKIIESHLDREYMTHLVIQTINDLKNNEKIFVPGREGYRIDTGNRFLGICMDALTRSTFLTNKLSKYLERKAHEGKSIMQYINQQENLGKSALIYFSDFFYPENKTLVPVIETV